jgi:hypothetical protein
MQPGPRNYDRSFIRDGSATAAVLLRMGLASIAREYLRWYADHAVHENGLVSPILNDDGTVPADSEELLGRLLTGRRPVEWQVLAEVVRSRPRHPYYLGDVPHTWVGAEYARALFGMLMHEEDERLDLLPGVPPSWVAGEGLRISELPTAFGTLSMSARQEGTVMRVRLEPGLRDNTPLEVDWPVRQRPVAVTVDGQGRVDYSADGIRLERPFRELVARW